MHNIWDFAIDIPESDVEFDTDFPTNYEDRISSLEKELKYLETQQNKAMTRLLEKNVKEVQTLRSKVYYSWDPSYCYRRFSMLYTTKTAVLTEKSRDSIIKDKHSLNQDIRENLLSVPQDKSFICINDIEEQYLDELTMLKTKQDKAYESLRLGQLKELLELKASIFDVKNAWKHIIWKGPLDKTEKGSRISDIQMFGPTKHSLPNISNALLMNLRCNLKEILNLVNDPNVRFFVAKPALMDGVELKAFENEVQKCHETSKAGCIPLKDNTRLYMIPMTKVTLLSGGNQHLIELLKDARREFLMALVPDTSSRKSSKKSFERWSIDIHKAWPVEQKPTIEPNDTAENTMATLDKTMLEDPEKLRLELLKKEREISILQEALRRSRSESNI